MDHCEILKLTSPLLFLREMGLLTLLLLIVVILALVGLGWKTFSSGIISGLDKAVDIGTPIIKNLTQEAREYVDSPDEIRTT